MQIRRIISHAGRTLIQGTLVASLVVGLVTGTALAAPSGSVTLTLKMVTDVNRNGAPNRGDVITFTFSTSATRPIINLTCSQGSTKVLYDSHPMFKPNLWNDPGYFPLNSRTWGSGGASCSAQLIADSGKRIVTLGTLNFTVGA